MEGPEDGSRPEDGGPGGELTGGGSSIDRLVMKRCLRLVDAVELLDSCGVVTLYCVHGDAKEDYTAQRVQTADSKPQPLCPSVCS